MPKPPAYFFYDAGLNKNGHEVKYYKALEQSDKALSP